MSNTTNIFDLPVDPAGGSSSNNVAISATDTPPQQQQVYSAEVPHGGGGGGGEQPVNQSVPTNENAVVDRANINSIVTGLQQASANGGTQLPSRDIPMTSHHLSQDEEIQPNYIPQAQQHEDYIGSDPSNEYINDEYNKQLDQSNMVDSVYDEFQTPLLLAILFFLFQLPFFKKILFKYTPVLFLSDGNYNLYGFIFISVFFAFVYYLLSKSVNLFNRF